MNKYSQRNIRNALLSIKFRCAGISFGDYCYANGGLVAWCGTMFQVCEKTCIQFRILILFFCGGRMSAAEEGGRILTSKPFACTIIP